MSEKITIIEPEDGFYALLYLHDWDPDGVIHPQAHGLYNNWKDAEKARKTKFSPEKYWTVRIRFVKDNLAKIEEIPDQNFYEVG